MAEQDLMSVIAEGSRVALRRDLPLKLSAVVEKDLGENRYMISSADSNFSLKLFQRELSDAYLRAKDCYGALEKVDRDEVKVGDTFLLVKSSSCVYRVVVLNLAESIVMCRFVDFGSCTNATFHELYKMVDSSAFEETNKVPPFITRVNLPPDELLLSLNLPTSAMIREGDLVDVMLLTTSAPHLAVFGLARSDSYRFLPKNFTAGFSADESENWLSLFDNKKMFGDAQLLPRGFGQLRDRDSHSDRLALISYAKSLDKVYVHDLESSIRLPLMRERMEMLFGNEKARKQFALNETITVGSGCVAYHSSTKSYVRGEVVSSGAQSVEIAPIDSPNYGLFVVGKSEVFAVPKSLQFPRQCFSVRMVRSSEEDYVRNCLSKLARCVLPDKTPVILNSEPKHGLVKIHCASAPKGVLSKTGFVALTQDKFQVSSIVEVPTGLGKTQPSVPEMEMLDAFVKRMHVSDEKPPKSAMSKKK